jgi:hypothetical protein
VIWENDVSSPVTIWLNMPSPSLWTTWAPIVHTFSDNPNGCWQCHRVESLKSEESAGRDHKLWNLCRHALFRWPYAPNHHSPKMDAHFALHRASSLFLFWGALSPLCVE